MKKLKLTINGEVKTFDLPENGEYKCEVTESYVPKAGDCVKIESKNSAENYYFKVKMFSSRVITSSLYVSDNKVVGMKGGLFCLTSDIIYTKITPEELKAKYAEAGYDWDYETDIIKPIKWIPKDGDEVWGLNAYIEPDKFIFSENYNFDKDMLEKGNLFPTKEECQKFADHCMKFINK